jgi:hypothetical protein
MLLFKVGIPVNFCCQPSSSACCQHRILVPSGKPVKLISDCRGDPRTLFIIDYMSNSYVNKQLLN